MPKYVTHLKVWFYSEGASPSEVIGKLLQLGFTPIRGAYDFAYEHSNPDITDENLGSAILEISNAIHKTLAGFKVLYTMDTHERESLDEILPLEDIDSELAQTRAEIEKAESEN
ncbi:MAG: hypothetical protein ACP6KW_01285 [Candidatus Thorarchaeota archaeon]